MYILKSLCCYESEAAYSMGDFNCEFRVSFRFRDNIMHSIAVNHRQHGSADLL